MIVQTALELTDHPYTLVDIPWEQTGWDGPVLAKINPLGQLPTVVLPDGTVLTETAAMLLHLDDLHPETSLVPPPGHADRPRFLRWLIFLVSAVYPTYTYGDVPRRWVEDDDAAAAHLRAGTDAHRIHLYEQLEREAGAPWFLGDTFSAIDLYLRPMSFWRPGREHWEASLPRLFAISERVGEMPSMAAVEARYFGA
jgi:GST-like protein